MIIYIDNDYKCHVEDSDGFRAIETNFFNGKCQSFIEGYQFIPKGEEWIRSDGVVFYGEMVSPWKNLDELKRIQARYEHGLLLEYESALSEIEEALGV